MSHESPEFTNPPVVETALGVQFVPISGLGSAHFGAFWESLGAEWKGQVLDAPPLALQHERFGDGGLPLARFELALVNEPRIRLKFRNQDRTRMVQVQNGRLHLNWIRTDEHPQYPRYRVLSAEFAKLWAQWVEFLQRSSFSPMTPDQWEVTYVNRIPKGEGWNSASDWPGVLSNVLGPGLPDDAAGVRFESAEGVWRFRIKPDVGRLHIEVGARPPTEQGGLDSLLIKITARGPIDNENPAVLEGLNFGHAAIVNAFAGITSPSMHERWGRTR